MKTELAALAAMVDSLLTNPQVKSTIYDQLDSMNQILCGEAILRPIAPARPPTQAAATRSAAARASALLHGRVKAASPTLTSSAGARLPPSRAGGSPAPGSTAATAAALASKQEAAASSAAAAVAATAPQQSSAAIAVAAAAATSTPPKDQSPPQGFARPALRPVGARAGPKAPGAAAAGAAVPSSTSTTTTPATTGGASGRAEPPKMPSLASKLPTHEPVLSQELLQAPGTTISDLKRHVDLVREIHNLEGQSPRAQQRFSARRTNMSYGQAESPRLQESKPYRRLSTLFGTEPSVSKEPSPRDFPPGMRMAILSFGPQPACTDI